MMTVARFRESLTLVLIAILPLHAMAVTVLTQFFQGSNHSPLLIIAVWKELILACLMVIAVVEIFLIRDADARHRASSLDALDWCILLALLIAGFFLVRTTGLSTLFSTQPSVELRKFLVGFKYDFLPLVAFFLLRRVAWTRDFHRSASYVLLAVGLVISVFGLVTLALPMEFFTALGYSDLHSLYRPHAPIAAFQLIEETGIRRIQSVMSGPNQFGLWLLIPLAAALQWFITTLSQKRYFHATIPFLSAALLSVTIGFTYSRSAWIGAAVLMAVLVFWILRTIVRSALYRSALLAGVGIAAALFLLGSIRYAPEIVLRSQSLMGHLEKPIQALHTIRTHPLGMGLGTAGPASNHFSDTCVFLPVDGDVSWAKNRTDLCVFLGGAQQIPTSKTCNCPLLTENWYLQWGVEMGYLGLLLCILIVALPLFAIRRISPFSLRSFSLLALAGLAVGSLFLHAFEDSGVAYTLWILLAAAGLRIPDPDYIEAPKRSGTLRL